MFYTIDAKNWNRSAAVTDLVGVTALEDNAGSARLDATIQDPINVAYDNGANRLLILQAQGKQLVEVLAGPDGHLAPVTLTRHNVVYFGLQKPQGLTVDPATGDLFILDAAGPRIVRVSGPHDSGIVTVTDLGASGITAPRGIAFDPSTGNLHIATPSTKILYELAQTGGLVASRDLAQFELKDIQGIVFAPSGDQTDDPSSTNLYLADSGPTGVQSTGQIVELSMTAPAALPAGTTILQTSPVQVIDTSNQGSWNPSAPDPSGLDYSLATNRLVISDSEVDEMPNYFQGKNVFLSTTSAALLSTCSTMSFTNEPTGVAINPNVLNDPHDDHIFFSTDQTDRIFELYLGGDGVYCTGDDTVTAVNVTNAYGITDAEDVAYADNTIFIAGGTDAEVYRVSLGNNRVLGGGDDVALPSFDTAVLGFNNLEGIGYSWDRGTLFILSATTGQKYAGETTITGTLLNVYDLNYSGFTHREDVTFAPGSQNPAIKTMYVTDRGVDNNADPNENDGQIWEIDISGGSTSDPDLIFNDGFESGGFSAWSANKADSGDLSVGANAALVETKGMQALIDDTVTIFLTSDQPNAEARYRARFYFDPNSITMASGNTHFIFQGLMGTSTAVTRLEFRFSSGAYQIRCNLINDSGAWTNSAWFTIGDAPHAIEVDWRAATSAGANNGGLTLWIDGTQRADLSGIDNDARRIDRARLGAVAGIDTGTQGTYYFDAFESRRQNYIGP